MSAPGEIYVVKSSGEREPFSEAKQPGHSHLHRRRRRKGARILEETGELCRERNNV